MEQTDTIDRIPDHLKCPICMEVPQRKVLQCREGHYLCETCYSKITNCPQCRIPFKDENIRNLYMEMMLDKFSMDCPYKKDGCTETVTRMFNLNHIESCFYNTRVFDPLVEACKTLGFEINKGNTHQFIQHLRHSNFVTSLLNENSLEIDFTDYDKFDGGRIPFILTLQEEGYTFIILVTHKPDRGLSWAAFYLRYPNIKLGISKNADPPLAYKVECSLKGGPPLTWSIFPEDILACDGVQEHFTWRQSDMFPVPGGSGSCPNSLTAYVNLRKVASVSGHNVTTLGNDSTLILTPFSMPAPCLNKTIKMPSSEGEVLQGKCSPTSLTKNRVCPYDEISEHLKCLICGKVPKGKIFQCKAGEGDHLLCEECYPEVGTCVKCHTRLPFVSERIRNLVVEKMLDELTLECPYQRSGCNETLNRKCIQEHMELCCYNVARFGLFISICEGLGLAKCPFKMNRGSTIESIRHFEEVHGATQHDLSTLEIEFADFANFPRSSTKPLIVNQKRDGYAYLILMTPDGEGLLAWDVFCLRYPKPSPSHSSKLELVLPSAPHKIECSLTSLNGRCSLSWSGASPKDRHFPVWPYKQGQLNFINWRTLLRVRVPVGIQCFRSTSRIKFKCGCALHFHLSPQCKCKIFDEETKNDLSSAPWGSDGQQCSVTVQKILTNSTNRRNQEWILEWN